MDAPHPVQHTCNTDHSLPTARVGQVAHPAQEADCTTLTANLISQHQSSPSTVAHAPIMSTPALRLLAAQ